MRRRPWGLACLSLLAGLATVPAHAAPCARDRAERTKTWFVSSPKLPPQTELNVLWHNNLLIEATAVDPVNPRVVFAGAGANLLRTNDGGCTWAHVYRLPDPPVTTGPDAETGRIVAIDASRGPGGRTRVVLAVVSVPYPVHPGRVTLVRSDDGYRDWTPVLAPELAGTYGRWFSWLPLVHSAGGVTYAMVPGPYGGVTYHRSTDGGKTWSPRSLTDVNPPARITGFAVNPWDPDELWDWGGILAAASGQPLTGLRRSTDGGASWAAVDPWPSYDDDKPTFLVADVAWPRRGRPARVLVLGEHYAGGKEDNEPIASWSGDGGATFSLAVPPLRGIPVDDATVTHLANGDAVIVTSRRTVYRLAHRGRAPRRGDWTFLKKVPEPGATWPGGNDDPTQASGTNPAVVVVRFGQTVQFLRVAR